MTEMNVRAIPIEEIFIDDDFNCRGAMAPIDVAALAEDIKTNGLHQPVLVMTCTPEESAKWGKKYKLIAGFRRTYAHKVLKYPQIMCVVKEHMAEAQALLINLSENLKREDLNILQEAQAIQKLERAGIIQERIAEYVGMSRGWVCARLDLLKLPTDIQKEAAAGMITQYQIRELAKLHSEPQMYEAVKKIKEAKMRGESTANIVQSKRKVKATARKHRKPEQIAEMIDYIIDQIGGNIGTKCLAWAAGNISDIDLFNALETFDPNFKKPPFSELTL